MAFHAQWRKIAQVDVAGNSDIHRTTYTENSVDPLRTWIFNGQPNEQQGILLALDMDGNSSENMIVSNPSKLDGTQLLSQLDQYGLLPVAVATGFVFGSRGLQLVNPDPEICRQSALLLQELVRFAAELKLGW